MRLAQHTPVAITATVLDKYQPGFIFVSTSIVPLGVEATCLDMSLAEYAARKGSTSYPLS